MDLRAGLPHTSLHTAYRIRTRNPSYAKQLPSHAKRILNSYIKMPFVICGLNRRGRWSFLNLSRQLNDVGLLLRMVLLAAIASLIGLVHATRINGYGRSNPLDSVNLAHFV